MICNAVESDEMMIRPRCRTTLERHPATTAGDRSQWTGTVQPVRLGTNGGPVEEPPNEPQKPPVEEPGQPPGNPPIPQKPPVEEPWQTPPRPPVKAPPPKDPDRRLSNDQCGRCPVFA